MTITCEDVQAGASAFIDDELPPERRAAMAAHVDSCDACAALVRDLSSVRDVAGTLGPIDPPARAWTAISAAITAERSSTPAGPSRIRAWFAVAAILVVLIAGFALARRFGHSRDQEPPTMAGGNPRVATPVDGFTEELTTATSDYDKAIADLSVAISTTRATATPAQRALDSSVDAALAEGLRTIDQAVDESRTALAAEPANDAARDSLVAALQQKIRVLQDVAAIASNDAALAYQR